MSPLALGDGQPPPAALALPPRPGLRTSSWLALAAVMGAIAWSAYQAEARPAVLFGAEARAAMADFATGFLRPALSPAFLGSLVRPLLETVAIAVCGLTLAFALGFPLSIAAADLEALGGGESKARGPGRWFALAARSLARLLLNVMRSVPDLIWALLAVRAVGLGPLPGVFALGLSFGGVLGKVFSEIYESTPGTAVVALRAAGATPAQAFRLAVLPEAMPLVASYTLYRFDCALRASAVLGLVGAGGLGQQLQLSLTMFAYDEVATLVLLLFLLVTGVDQLSRRLRARLASGVPGPVLAGSALAWAGLAAWGAASLELSPVALFGAEARAGIAAFAADAWPPEVTPGLLGALLPALAETLAIAIFGTALAAGAALLLSLPASRELFVADRAGELLRPRGLARLIRGALHALARATIVFGRTLPEVLWALVFILAVGLGPFAGALALAIHTAGVLGRLYAEAFEEVPRGPVEAALGGGASRLATFVHSILPQAAPQLLAYTLYRFEVNVRASAVLGIVGAGGIGKLLHIALSLFLSERALTLVLAVMALVALAEGASGVLRRLVRSRGGHLREGFTSL
ncbi:MAG: ABC transporter permease subunit [Myxococcaceae bacterium]|nr:ABC transporter permease subunit [Myxococcaceae bacterium]